MSEPKENTLHKLFEIIEERRKTLNLTQTQVSELALGQSSTSAIQNLKRGKSPTLDTLLPLVETLGLEFYVGPRRDQCDQGGVNDRIAIPSDDRPGSGDVVVDGEEISLIKRYKINVSAGPGFVVDEEAQSGGVAFSQRWLRRNGINEQVSGLVRVKGDSMEPTIPDGALVLVHVPEMQIEREAIFAFSRNGEAFIKRLVPGDFDPTNRPRMIAVVSDNHRYPTEVIVGDALNELRIVGRVRCALTDF